MTAAYDGTPATAIEQVRRQVVVASNGITETRTTVRRYAQDVQDRLVMSGIDSLVKRDLGAPGRTGSLIVHVRRYADIRYRMNDPQFTWPMTGLVVLELSHAIGAGELSPPRATSHASPTS